MNAVQLVETTHDPANPSSSGINVYKIVRSTGPGLPFWPRPAKFQSALSAICLADTIQARARASVGAGMAGFPSWNARHKLPFIDK